MQFKISINKGSFFWCANTIKQTGCIQEIYFRKIKNKLVEYNLFKIYLLIKEVVLMNQMPPDT